MESGVQGKRKSAVDDGTDSESNSYEKNDDMSEDEIEVLGGGGKGADLVTNDGSESSDDGGGAKRGKKRRRAVKIKVKVEGGRKSKSKVRDVFDKVTVLDPYEKEKEFSKAKCKFCKKHYAYTQGSTKTTLARHMKTCEAYKKHIEKKLGQTLLNFAPSKAALFKQRENGPGSC